MLRALSVVSLVLLLAGCATAPRPQMHVMPVKPKPAVVAPVVTPNDQVKHRWYDKFKRHQKFFH